ncbi:MAG: glycosyltransferase [Clostridiales bacterium]|nr:glycosyltransferase [Clostridiales bacterium]
MITISICMIVKNEEDVLARCLDCAINFADEIIIVDTGSTDRTKEIAALYTEQVYDFEWIDDFAAARNFAFSKATMEYCMWLDADDIIRFEDQKKLVDLKNTLPPDTDMVMMRYHTGFDKNGNPTFSYNRERLIKNNKGYSWQGAIHEAITPCGNILYTDIAVCHQKVHPTDPDRNINIFEKLRRSGHSLDMRQQFYYGRELYWHRRYEEAKQAFLQVIDSPESWIENKIESCRQLARCLYKLGQAPEALLALLRSFAYDEPRAEICCDIGRHFFEQEHYRTAAFWYSIALTRTKNEDCGAFVEPDCYGYLPSIQLCVCFDRLGEHDKAAAYNEKAAAYKPDSEACRQNRIYFSNLNQR